MLKNNAVRTINSFSCPSHMLTPRPSVSIAILPKLALHCQVRHAFIHALDVAYLCGDD